MFKTQLNMNFKLLKISDYNNLNIKYFKIKLSDFFQIKY